MASPNNTKAVIELLEQLVLGQHALTAQLENLAAEQRATLEQTSEQFDRVDATLDRIDATVERIEMLTRST